MAKAYATEPENALIVSPDNASRRQLNLADREELRATGRLGGKDRTFRVLIQRQDLTGADRAWAKNTKSAMSFATPEAVRRRELSPVLTRP